MSEKSGKSLTQDSVAEVIRTRFGLSKELSVDIVKRFFAVVKDEIANDKSVKLLRFGTLKNIRSSDRIAMDFKTGSRIKVEGKDEVRLVPSRSFKEYVHGFDESEK